MALALHNFSGFETQGNEESNLVVGSPAYVSSPKRSGTVALHLPGASTQNEYQIDTESDFLNNQIYSIWVNFTDLTPNAAYQFMQGSSSSSVSLWKLRLETDGGVTFVDAGDVDKETAGTPFTVNTWHRIDIFNSSAGNHPTTIYVDGSLILGPNNAGSTASSNLNLMGPSTVGEEIYFDDFYNLDDATDIDDRLGDVEVFAYQNTAEDATDQGDTLADGTWALVSEVPLNEGASNDASYVDTGNLTGSTICDEGTRSGPSGDANVDGDSNIKAAKWVGRFKRGAGGGRTHSFLIGNSGDGVTAKTIALGTGYATFSVVSEAAGEVPLSTESFQHGFSKDLTGGQDIFCGDIWAMLLHVPSAVVADPSTDAESFIAGQQQPVIEQTEIVGY